ncbi:MAG: hypothetical protein EA423_03150 [Phycisphaerales bacterium]|nr:MAG: hypothetical protein EA423_03150 [Phycisphaerales bacterium]
MARKKKQRQEAGVPEWVVTYGDLMSLLLCFFILLAAFSELKQPREYRRAVESIQEALGFKGGLGQIINKGNPRNTMINRMRENATMAGDKASRAEINEQNVPGRDQTVTALHDGSRWAIGGGIAFEAGSWELTPAAEEALASVAERIRGQHRKVELRGHAWGVADLRSGLDYRELSFRRALEAERYLVEKQGVRAEILLPVAAGNTEPKAAGPFDVGDTTGNRRVEIVLTEQTLSERHPNPEWQGP